MPEFLGDELRGIGVDHIGDLVHGAVLHQVLDDVDAALGHAVGKLLDGDDLGNHHLALDLLLLLGAGLLLLALAVALQRGKAPLALLLVERVGDGEAAANALFLAAPGRHGALLVAGVGRARRRFLGLLLKVLAAGRLLDLGLRLLLGGRFLLLLPLALLGLFVLFRPLLGEKRLLDGRLLGPLALLGVAHARIGERLGARVLLLLGELLQHDARTALPRLLGARLGRGLGGGRGLGFGLGLLGGRGGTTRADRAALLFLDQNGLAAPVAEALAHMARLHGPAQVQGHLAPASLAFSLVGLTHSLSVSDPFRSANAALPLR